MKPTKNRVHCPYCDKPKMLFETGKKAANFIKFNAQEILEENGYAPVRAYWCSGCGGWHVTSHMTEFQILRNKVYGQILDLELNIKEMDKALSFGHYDECNRLVQAAVRKYSEVPQGIYTERMAQIKHKLTRILSELMQELAHAA